MQVVSPVPESDATRMPERFLGWKEVRSLVCLSRTTVHALRRRGEFPQPVALTTGRRTRLAWHAGEITAWMRNRPRVAA